MGGSCGVLPVPAKRCNAVSTVENFLRDWLVTSHNVSTYPHDPPRPLPFLSRIRVVLRGNLGDCSGCSAEGGRMGTKMYKGRDEYQKRFLQSSFLSRGYLETLSGNLLNMHQNAMSVPAWRFFRKRPTDWLAAGLERGFLSMQPGNGGSYQWLSRFECKRLSDPAENSMLNRHVFGQGSCYQQGHIAVSERASHRPPVQDQS
jgi:hypothetical protein